MTNIVETLERKNLINPPHYVVNGLSYITIMGSMAYGVSSDSSDMDLYGFCIPPIDDVFPHVKGEIQGFGHQTNRFEQYQKHHIEDKSSRKEYDITVYSIVKYFQLCMENNPNVIDSLFTPKNCVLYKNDVGEILIDNRKIFLHKGAWHKFKGYAYSQMKKIKNKTNSSNPIRKQDIDKNGYNTKFAYHIVRLISEVEQILIEGDLDLQRNREQLKSIRRGEWTVNQIEEWFTSKEKTLESLYVESSLPERANEDRIKDVLMNCLEHHYGSLDNIIRTPDRTDRLISELNSVLSKYR